MLSDVEYKYFLKNIFLYGKKIKIKKVSNFGG